MLRLGNKRRTNGMVGDAGDGGRASDITSSAWRDLLKHETTALYITVTEIREALQNGNINDLHALLFTLESWRHGAVDKNSHHNYWRVGQLVGETELGTIYTLLTLAVEKSDETDSNRWLCLEDLCRLLTVCLCNREIVYQLVHFCPSICYVLVLAMNQAFDTQREGLACNAVRIMEVSVTVCKWRFARCLVDSQFLDHLLERLGHDDPHLLSWPLLEQILHLLKSLLMCGQPATFQYTASCIDQMCRHFLTTSTSTNELTSDSPDPHHASQPQGGHEDRGSRDDGGVFRNFLKELQASTRNDNTARLCAKHWTKHRRRKDLLGDCLSQPFLLVFCSWPICALSNSHPKAFLRKCAACQCVRYCSRKCQENHWKAGHKWQCKFLAKRTAWIRHDH